MSPVQIISIRDIHVLHKTFVYKDMELRMEMASLIGEQQVDLLPTLPIFSLLHGNLPSNQNLLTLKKVFILIMSTSSPNTDHLCCKEEEKCGTHLPVLTHSSDVHVRL